jgi:hypothetical protein
MAMRGEEGGVGERKSQNQQFTSHQGSSATGQGGPFFYDLYFPTTPHNIQILKRKQTIGLSYHRHSPRNLLMKLGLRHAASTAFWEGLLRGSRSTVLMATPFYVPILLKLLL